MTEGTAIMTPVRTYDLARGELRPEILDEFALPFDVDDLLRRGFNYVDRRGSTTLRSAFVLRVGKVAHEVEATLVAHGALGALDLALRAWPVPARRLLCLAPTYREALTIARSNGLAPVEIPRCGQEIDVEWVRRNGRPGDEVYIVPTLNNPDGFTLTAQARHRLAEAIAAGGAGLVEDDAYGPLAEDFGELPSVVAALLQVAPDRPAVRLTSFSKLVMPGARICVVEGAPLMIAQLDAAKADFGTSPLASAFVEQILADEQCWQATLTAVRGRLVRGLAAARAELAAWPLPVRYPFGGYFLWLPTGDVDPTAFRADTAGSIGVAVADGSVFYPGQPSGNHVRLSTAWESPERVAQGCAAIRDKWIQRVGG